METTELMDKGLFSNYYFFSHVDEDNLYVHGNLSLEDKMDRIVAKNKDSETLKDALTGRNSFEDTVEAFYSEENEKNLEEKDHKERTPTQLIEILRNFTKEDLFSNYLSYDKVREDRSINTENNSKAGKKAFIGGPLTFAGGIITGLGAYDTEAWAIALGIGTLAYGLASLFQALDLASFNSEPLKYFGELRKAAKQADEEINQYQGILVERAYFDHSKTSIQISPLE